MPCWMQLRGVHCDRRSTFKILQNLIWIGVRWSIHTSSSKAFCDLIEIFYFRWVVKDWVWRWDGFWLTVMLSTFSVLDTLLWISLHCMFLVYIYLFYIKKPCCLLRGTPTFDVINTGLKRWRKSWRNPRVCSARIDYDFSVDKSRLRGWCGCCNFVLL